MNDLVRTILILVLAAGIAAVAFVTWRTGRRGPVQQAEKALEALCPLVGLSPIDVSASSVDYFRNHQRLGCPLRAAAGQFDGFQVEICYVPLVKRSDKGRTMIGVHCPKPLGVEVGLTWRDPLAGIVNSLFGQANGVGSKPLFGRYDSWGATANVQKFFPSHIQSLILTFPTGFEQILVNGEDVVMIWTGIEEDVRVVKRAFELARALYNIARESIVE